MFSLPLPPLTSIAVQIKNQSLTEVSYHPRPTPGTVSPVSKTVSHHNIHSGEGPLFDLLCVAALSMLTCYCYGHTV